MKKLLLLLLAISSLNAYSQKKKKVAFKSISTNKTTLAKSDNLSAELIEKKGNYYFYVLNGKDTLTTKSIEKKNGMPLDVKITPFTASGIKLYSVVWTEKRSVGDAKTKLENIVEYHTEVWNATTKAKVFENTQTVINVLEVVWLDANKTASKNVEKIKRDGSQCIITPEGDIILKNKTQETKLGFDSAAQKFVSKK